MTAHRLGFIGTAMIAALTLAVPGVAGAQARAAPPVTAAPAAVTAATLPVLSCQLVHPVFGRSVAQVTNIGATTLAPGQTISVFAVQTGSAGGAMALSAPLPPGGRVNIPMAGTAILASGCVANAG